MLRFRVMCEGAINRLMLRSRMPLTHELKLALRPDFHLVVLDDVFWEVLLHLLLWLGERARVRLVDVVDDAGLHRLDWVL